MAVGVNNLTEYNTRNRRLFEKGLTEHINKVVERDIDLVFNIVIDSVYNWLDNCHTWENDTYNLYDSIGLLSAARRVEISQNTRLCFLPLFHTLNGLSYHLVMVVPTSVAKVGGVRVLCPIRERFSVIRC